MKGHRSLWLLAMVACSVAGGIEGHILPFMLGCSAAYCAAMYAAMVCRP